MKVTLIGRHTYWEVCMHELQCRNTKHQRYPSEDGELNLILVQLQDSSVWNLVLFQYPVGFFCCNFMFCLIVQSGRCDFHVTFYPSVFLYQKDKQKVLWASPEDGLIYKYCQKHTDCTRAELSSRWAQKAPFCSPSSPLLQIRILCEWLIKR